MEVDTLVIAIMRSKTLIATLAGIGVGLLVWVLLGLAGIGSFSVTSEPVLMILILLGSASAIGGAGGLTTGTVARVRRGAAKGLLTGAAVGVILEAVALAATYLTTALRAPVSNEHAAFGTLALVFLGLLGASVGGPIAAGLITGFRRPPVAS